MADNVNVTPGTGAIIAADDIGGVLYQRVKIGLGADGAATDLSPGQKTMANSVPIVIASDQTEIPTRGNAGTLTDRSGTITTGGTSQQIAAGNSTRRYLIIINISTTTLWVNFGTSAVQGSPSIPLAPASVDSGYDGGILIFENMFVPSGTVNIIGATTGKAFVAKEA